MPDTIATLRVKDATGSNITLSAVSGTNGIATYHALTGTIASDISSSLNYTGISAGRSLVDIQMNTSYLSTISSNISTVLTGVNNTLQKITDISASYSQTSSNASLSKYDYNQLKDGMGTYISEQPTRLGIIFYNSTDKNVYVRISSPPTVSNDSYNYLIPASGSKEILDSRFTKFRYYFTGSDNTQGNFLVTTFTV